jgi:hypothetical protein
VIYISVRRRADGVWSVKAPGVLPCEVEGTTAVIALAAATRGIRLEIERALEIAMVRARALDAAPPSASAPFTVKRQILDLARAVGTFTCDDVEASLGLLHATVSARIRELVLEGKLIALPTRGRTRARCHARKYRIADAQVV